MPAPRKKGDGYTNIPDGLLDGGFPAQVGAAAYAVYLVYRKLRDKDGSAYPSLTYIQQATGFGRPTVSRAIEKLRELGWLRCDHIGRAIGDPSRYYVPLVEAGELVTNRNQLHIETSNDLDAELVTNRNPTITSVLLPESTHTPRPPAHTRTHEGRIADLCRALPPFIPEKLRPITESIVAYWGAILPDYPDRLGRNIGAQSLQKNMLDWVPHPLDKIEAEMTRHIEAAQKGVGIKQPLSIVTRGLRGELPTSGGNGSGPKRGSAPISEDYDVPPDHPLRRKKF